ncbi:hypothetical protein [Corynebacterium bovis]|uniref:Uncharacterized protein n=1 Tax=Corynebacterium bovis DSM 20582 = CIP 54.80 TaxID=927655 RepID=A0A8I0CMQ1_9CORY|nr:hypothetical protein [Corynebacterium bovis]MBB3115918.1 hypothetical protein [Corynebacterium bovis DSM 20582 = CIP 54.80]
MTAPPHHHRSTATTLATTTATALTCIDDADPAPTTPGPASSDVRGRVPDG